MKFDDLFYFTVGFLVVFLLFPKPADAWNIHRIENSCYLGQVFTDNSVLTLHTSVDREEGVGAFITIIHPEPVFDIGDNGTFDYQIGDKTWSGEPTSRSTNSFSVGIPSDFFAEFADGKSLRVSSEKMDTNFNLAGSRAGIEQLTECFRSSAIDALTEMYNL